MLANTTNSHIRWANTTGVTKDVYIRGGISTTNSVGRIVVMKFGADFDGDYNSLTGLPTLFSGAWADLTGKPTIPADVGDLTDTGGLLGGGGGGFVSMGYASGGQASSSTSYRFSGAISLPAGHTITGWSSDQTNMAITWRDNYQGSTTILGTGSYTNSGGSAVNVYAWCNTSNSNARSVTYQIFG
jgi:hypothetical protein